MTRELYDQVKDEIPKHIGAYIKSSCVKRAKKQKLKTDEQILKNSMIRSLYREVEKQIRSGNPTSIEQLTRISNQYKRESERYRKQYWDLQNEIYKKYGTRWNKESI
jgi:chaperonin cofactor prefoldin